MNKSTVEILVADDDEFSRTLMRSQLEGLGYADIHLAENGLRALEILNSRSIDILLLDLEMPELSGMDVLKHVKSRSELHKIPVIVISGVEEIDQVAECIELGAEDFLQKPFNPVLLKARLNQALEKIEVSELISQNMQDINNAKRRTEKLLNVIMPPFAAQELKASGAVKPKVYDEIAVLFCDICNFTNYCETNSAESIVNNLQNLFGAFEEICEKNSLEKIKTIGDEFMAVGGLSFTNMDPLRCSIDAGLEMIKTAPEICSEWDVRVGINLGSVTGGVVGKNKFQFDVWGNTVNVAARMAAVATPKTIAMTHECWLRAGVGYCGNLRGEVEIKGKRPLRIVECDGVLNRNAPDRGFLAVG